MISPQVQKINLTQGEISASAHNKLGYPQLQENPSHRHSHHTESFNRMEDEKMNQNLADLLDVEDNLRSRRNLNSRMGLEHSHQSLSHNGNSISSIQNMSPVQTAKFGSMNFQTVNPQPVQIPVSNVPEVIMEVPVPVQTTFHYGFEDCLDRENSSLGFIQFMQNGPGYVYSEPQNVFINHIGIDNPENEQNRIFLE